MKCCIVKDLLPGYIDGLTSEETNAELKKHLQGCDACRTVCGQMSSELKGEMPREKSEIDFVKKLKIKIRQRYMLGAYLVCAILLGAFSCLNAYGLPVPYDSKRMTVEMFQIAYTPDSHGLMQWADVNSLEPEQARKVGDGAYDSLNRVRLVLQESVRSDGMESVGRTIWRAGEPVRVVYYCYTRSLWGSLFPGNSRFVDSSISDGAVYENSFFRDPADRYQPQKREIYYLPVGNMNRLNRLTDEEFDAQKKGAALVWSGVI